MNRHSLQLRFFSLLSLLILTGGDGHAQDTSFVRTATVTQLFVRGYQILHTNPAEATRLFVEITRREPENLLAQRQLGALYANSGKRAEALDRFLIVQRLAPSDSNLLQIAYLYNGLGENGKALAYFGLLRKSPYPGIASVALRAIDNLTPLYCADRSPSWGRLTGSGHYDSRFEDFITSVNLLAGRGLGEGRALSLYGVLTLNADSRSTGGSRPVIYSDNYALIGGGFRFRPYRNWTIDLQPGISYDLLERPGEKRWKGDFRAVTTIGAGHFPSVDVPAHLATPWSPFVDAFLSYGYYSRYTNTIGYGQARAGLRTLAFRHSAVDLYLRGDLTFDTGREFFNNTLEGSIGARVVPDHRWGINLLVEYHRGTYTVTPPHGGTSRWYSSFRLLLVADRFFCL